MSDEFTKFVLNQTLGLGGRAPGYEDPIEFRDENGPVSSTSPSFTSSSG